MACFGRRIGGAVPSAATDAQQREATRATRLPSGQRIEGSGARHAAVVVRFIERHRPHLGALVRKDQEEVADASDVLGVGLNDLHAIDTLKRMARTEQTVIDLARFGAREGLRARYVGLAWP